MFAYAAAQVKKAMEVTQLLGGENYVFWGGREGYSSLINTGGHAGMQGAAGQSRSSCGSIDAIIPCGVCCMASPLPCCGHIWIPNSGTRCQ